MNVLATSLGWLLAGAVVHAEVADILAYADTAAAQQAWVPQFGSPPARVEVAADGPCLVLEGSFKAAGERLCWDWHGALDLSQVEAVSADIRAENSGAVGNLGIYFGTPGGWYAHFGWGGPADAWTRHNWGLGEFGSEGTPAGWGQVNCFRFSAWAATPGKVTFRLRGFRAVPLDRQRNFLRNGSFEVPGPLPYAWGSGHWGIGHLPWAADMDLWRRHFALDAQEAHDGRVSLRLDNETGLPRLQAQTVWFGLPGAAGVTYTASAWLRADREGLPVTLACGERSVNLEVGQAWQRAVLPDVPPGPQQHLTCGATADGTLWIDAVQVQASANASAAFHPHPEDEGLCQREAKVDWSPPRRTADIAAGRRTAGPLGPAKVTIDGNGRFLLDGVPYLQHSLGLEFISDPQMLDVVAAAGFSDVCIEVKKSIATAELRVWFDRCAKVGLRVIPWLDGDIPLERFRGHVTALKDHPALLCWYVFDEPSGDRFAEADRRLTLAHELDPGHPALINYLGNKLTGHLGDIYSTDIYPIPHGSPSAAIQGVAAMAAAAAPEHKPVWMWLQGTGYAYWMDREPTPRELSCMAYGSLVAGARGLYYFAQVPRSQQCWAEMRALCVEVSRLTPVLGSLESAPPLRCEPASVMARAYRQGTEVWVLAVNTRGEQGDATFGLPVKVGTAEVVFEGREVTLREGAWTDTFGAYERHVYRLVSPP
jgi:hypothetical protein